MEDHTWTTGGIVQGSIDERVKPVRAAIPHSGHWGLLGGIEGSDPAGEEGSLVVRGRRREWNRFGVRQSDPRAAIA